MERSKGSRLKGWIESPNALRRRLGELVGCAFTETESSKIIIGKLGRRVRHSKADQPTAVTSTAPLAGGGRVGHSELSSLSFTTLS
jgi:hypothetical protein